MCLHLFHVWIHIIFTIISNITNELYLPWWFDQLKRKQVKEAKIDIFRQGLQDQNSIDASFGSWTKASFILQVKNHGTSLLATKSEIGHSSYGSQKVNFWRLVHTSQGQRYISWSYQPKTDKRGHHHIIHSKSFPTVQRAQESEFEWQSYCQMRTREEISKAKPNMPRCHSNNMSIPFPRHDAMMC